MKWKKYIVGNLFILHALSGWACADCYSPESCYMFSVYDRNALMDHSVRKNVDYWVSYTGGKVSPEAVQAFLYASAPVSGDTDISLLNFLKQRNDGGAIRYLGLVQMLNGVGEKANPWEYPTKAELQRWKNIRIQVAKQAREALSQASLLHDRYLLIAMRASFGLGDESACKTLWDTYGSRIKDSFVRDACEGYMAHFWYKGGEREKARRFYARVGDINSLRWCFRDAVGLRGIEKLYHESPTSVAFPYLLQDYVNGMDGDWSENKSSRSLSCYNNRECRWLDSISLSLNNEMTLFRSFATRVIKDEKTDNPALWLSASAYLAYLQGKSVEAVRLLDEASLMNGATRIKDNIRTIRFLVCSDEQPEQLSATAFRTYVLSELKWLVEKMRTEPLYEDFFERSHYIDALQRIVYYHLVPRYQKSGDFLTASLLTGMVTELTDGHSQMNQRNSASKSSYQYNMDYSNRFFALLDTSAIESVRKTISVIRGTGYGDALQLYAASHCYNQAAYLNELLGTKYLREGKFQEALPFFKAVPLSFISKMNVAPYLALRNPSVPLWFRKQPVDWEELDKKVTLKVNPKADFCQEMLRLEHDYRHAPDSVNKAEIGYQLAVRYYQASSLGQCWALSHYGWSAGGNYLSAGQEHFVEKARNLLIDALRQDDRLAVKARNAYALAFLTPDRWRTWTWENFKETASYHPQSEQAVYYKILKPLIGTDVDVYGLGHCDELMDYIRRN